ncbi:hypothetical protein [Verrucomicrobium spinosum]|uniref:hypothetical protein n=1 Tax=Verrucomicrobium spinosum TaxID=2736 RepID=UPI0012F6C214|nr:hypothetical protein [Verrucomicrobium spinosum]
MRCLLSVALLSLAFASVCAGQSIGHFDQKTAKGAFYVSVDDRATLYINGMLIHRWSVGEERSPEIEIRTGDRITVKLEDDGGEKRFMMIFASTDGQTVVSFRNRDFKIIPELDATDFTPEEFEKWKKFAVQFKHKDRLPIKSYSDWVWGDLKNSILGCVLMPKMFTQKPR